MCRCYGEETTRARTLAVGVFSELYLTILSIPVFLIGLQTPPSRLIQIALPIPLLLVIGIVLLVFTPPARPPETWNEVVSTQSKDLN